MHFWQKFHRKDIVASSVHHLGSMMSICLITGDINLDDSVTVMSIRFLHSKDTIFSFVITIM